MYISIIVAVTVLLIVLDILGYRRKKAKENEGLTAEEFLIRDAERRSTSFWSELFFKDWKSSILMFICLCLGIYASLLAFRYSGFERGLLPIVLGAVCGESFFFAIRIYCMK